MYVIIAEWRGVFKGERPRLCALQTNDQTPNHSPAGHVNKQTATAGHHPRKQSSEGITDRNINNNKQTSQNHHIPSFLLSFTLPTLFTKKPGTMSVSVSCSCVATGTHTYTHCATFLCHERRRHQREAATAIAVHYKIPTKRTNANPPTLFIPFAITIAQHRSGKQQWVE